MEIGSDFNLHLDDLTVKKNNIFRYLHKNKNIIFFDSGRSALKHIVRHLEKGITILLPEFICESVISCFKEQTCVFYKINSDFSINIEDLTKKLTDKVKVVFLMHYFGTLQPITTLETIKDIAVRNNSVIIEDTTHSIFSSMQTIGDYMICSIRKWFPVPKGGVLYSSNDPLKLVPSEYEVSSDNKRVYAMILKDMYLSGKINSKSEYRELFEESEHDIDDQTDCMMMSDLSRFIVSCVDVSDLKLKRQSNYRFLQEGLSRIDVCSPIEICESQCPLVFPVRAKDRDGFRNYLIEHDIYCAVHWPFDGFMKEKRDFAYNCSRELISLPIDQRYTKEHMQYMLETIYDYGDGLIS